MTRLYRARWTTEYGLPGEEDFAHWLAELNRAGIDHLTCLKVARYCTHQRPAERPEQAGWPPRLPEFMAIAMQLLVKGLPTPREALQEAIRATGRWGDFPWSHPAVHLAALDVGRSALTREGTAVLERRFNEAYLPLVARVRRGESLQAPVPRVEPACRQSHQEMPAKEKRNRLQTIRALIHQASRRTT